ncbi:MAG: hypothetical protein M5U34_02650 [Chloroflexi bacterium]|nr:hypothetical protein [Chloroflexota bacterium]
MAATRVVKVGSRLDLEKTVTTWQEIGYEAVSVVEDAGQFSRRGGIVDIFPPGVPFPLRIELFGDEIDTLRLFDPTTQRSMDLPPEMGQRGIVIPPAREALPAVAARYGAALSPALKPEPDSLPSWRDDMEALADGRSFAHLEFYLPLIYAQPATLLDYLPDKALLVVDDWHELETAVAELRHHADQIAEEQPSLPPIIPIRSSPGRKSNRTWPGGSRSSWARGQMKAPRLLRRWPTPLNRGRVTADKCARF